MREPFTATDVIYKAVVRIQNDFAMSNNLQLYEQQWRYLLNMFPEVEKDVPPEIMAAIEKYKKVEKAVDVS